MFFLQIFVYVKLLPLQLIVRTEKGNDTPKELGECIVSCLSLFVMKSVNKKS